MKLPANAHVAVVDGTQFKLFCNSGVGEDIKLAAVDTGDIASTNKSAGVRDHDAGMGNDGGRELAELAHGAGVAAYLNEQVLSGKIKHLAIIADPDTLGEMRRHYHKELQAALVGEVNKTLTNSSTDDIQKSLMAA